MVNRFVADPGMYAGVDRFEANRQRMQNMKNERVGGKEIRKLDMAKYEANRRRLQNQKFDRVGGKEIRKMDMDKFEANRRKLQNQKADRTGPFAPGGTEMSVKYGDPQAYRYCDHPRPGSLTSEGHSCARARSYCGAFALRKGD